ncbi:titin [Mytilus galloprovincialis]|uniref:Titin n=1 Tax=Mytilus galloprovincialis TaxID=29158 RepID=A0A8B6G027_MYTGA|nr:titin [Mytilus galloprovincialis]
MSDKFSDITDLSELPPSTTTISTVAVQSGRSKVVLAILRGAEWIRVRVHQMEPDLMEVGSTLEEALQYRQEHHEMLNKLKAKEQEIKQILTSADQYAAENTSQAEVYAAMADTMGEAWKELNNKLEYRGILLDDSVHFHQSAADFSSKMEQAQSKFSSTYPTQDVNTARRLLQQHQDIKRSILESSKTTHDIGHSLVRRIQDMGMHADLQNRHATTAACYGIEHVLELLQDRRRRLEEIWEQRRIQLEQCLQLCQLDQEVNKILDWFRQTGFSYLQNTDLGDCHQRSQIIQHEHYKFETQAKETQETVLRLVRTADQLLRRSKLDVEGVRQRLQTVDTECENFMIRLDTRRKNITMATSFFEQTESALTRLDQVEVQLNTMDLPRNSAELADRHSQLSNAIMEISSPPLRDGRILLERVSRDDRGADGIRRLLAQLQDRCTRLESLCKARRAEAWERSQAYLHFQEKFTSLQTWLLQIGQATLSRHADLGTRLESAEDFLEIHEQLDQDIRDKNSDLEALFEAGVNLVKSGDQEAHNAAEKVDTLHQQMQRIHRVIEFRITLSLVYLSFHKKVQQFQNNAGGLEHILKSEKEHLQDLTDSAVQHTQELWNITSQQYHEVDDKGREFLSKTSTINDDSSLNIKQAVLIVERIMTETRESMTTLTTTWESWQQKVSSSRQFKTQWHQFIQDARKTIDWVMSVENEFFPVIAGELGTSVETVKHYEKRLDEFSPVFQKGLEELENHMTTGEMLLMKGDTRGQLDQIMNELTKVYHRFKARIHEYHILVKMTIQFFRNLDQLDKLIEKTEQEYSQSNLPADLTHAEKMLEEHKRKKTEVSSLINYTADEGEKIVVRVRQTDAEAAAQEDVERVLNVTAEYKQRWNQAWEDQEKRLKQNLQICQFNYDLRQIHSEIDELHHHLQARRGSYGNSLPASKLTSQAFKQFEMTVELIEKKINKFTSTAELMVQDHHYDSAHIGREIDMLNTKWTTFHMSVRDYRKMIDTSIDYYQLTEETEQWLKDGNNLLNDIGRKIVQCKTPQEVDDLVKPMDQFLQEGKPKQEERLRKLSELAVELYALDRPVIHQMTNDISMPEGKGFKIEVIFSGSPTPEVAWFRGQDRVVPSSVFKITIEINRTTLQVTEAYPEDSGSYTVILQNAAGEIQKTCQVNVESFYSSAAEDMSQASAENEPMAPSFTQKLAPAREAMEGSRVRLDCVLVGHPEPEVVWFHNDKPVKESKDIQLLFEGDRCTLSIQEAYLEDAGVYRCEARNPYGNDQTVSKLHVEPLSELSDASVNEATPPKFTQLLRDLNVQSGHRVCLQCRVTGHPIPDVQWFKDGKPIELGPDYQVTAFADVHNLTIPEAFVEDTGTYMVKAVNMVGEAKSYAKLSVKTTPEPMETSEVMKMRQMIQTKESQETKLVKKELEQSPPEFQRLFHDMTVNAGEPVNIECSISGSPKPKVTWYFNGMPIVSRDYIIRMEGTRHTLHIPETFDEDSGRFSITAENPLGKATCSAYLFVEEESTIPKTRIFGSSEMTRRVSKTETVSSHETRISRFIETQETQQPTYIPSSEQHSTTITTDVTPQYDIRPIETRETHATTLKTDVKPRFQPVDLTIAVPVPPKFVQALKNIETMEGTRVTFEGVVSGKPEPSIKWYREGKELTDKADFEISYNDGRVSLNIPEAFPEDQGQFKCTARNMAGQASSSAELIVKASMVPPSFIQRPQTQTVKEGKPVRFTIRVAGQPPPEITWYKDGSKITSSPDFELVQEDDIHSLCIPEVFCEDAGQYTVEAKNPAGQTQCTANLRIEVPMEESVPDKPQPVTEERFEPKRAPAARSAPEEPTPKVRKLQLPSDFVKKTESPREVSPRDQRYREEVKMEMGRKPDMPTYEQTFRLPAGEPVQVTPKQKPRFTQPLQNKNVDQGEPVVFEARVEAHPEPIIKWYRDDVVVRSSPDYEITYDNGVCRLSIAETFPEDSGVFKVIATNADGSDTTQAKLQVQRSPIMSPVSEAFKADKAPTREERIPSPIEPEAPRFTQLPQNQKLKEGTNTVFDCTVTGKPFPDVSWRKRGFPIRVSQRYRITIDENTGRITLTIVNSKPDDVGQYTCTAVNLMGQTDTTATLIQPEEKMAPPPPAPKTWQPMVTEQPLKPWQQQPEMTQQPTRPWYQQPDVTQQPVKPWQQQQEMAQPRKRSDFFVPRSEKNLETNIQYRLSQEREVPIVTSTLEFTPTGFEQSLMQRQFYKEGHIKFSSETETSEYESDVTTDRVQPSAPAPPKIVQELKDFRLLEGSDATFVCRITGRPRPKVAWYKNGQRIKRSTRYEMKYNKDGYSTLRIRMALPEDAGHYTVLAVNSSGKDTCSSELYVDSIGNIDSTSFVGKEALDKILGVDKDKDKRPEEEGGIMEALSRPLFKKVPEDREVREGNTVRFDTLVSGRPAPELTWYRDDVQVHNDDQHKIVVNEDGVNSLIILAASRNDSGHYTCLANNKAGENSFTVELKILEKEQMQPPRFVERIQNFNIREGQPVTLRCQVIGIPQPMISWQKDGKMLIPNKPYRIETEGGRSTLTIDTVEPFDSAWFQCSAANVAGTATTRGKLTVKSEVKKPEPKKKITIQKKQVSPVKEVPEPAPKPVVLRPTPKPQPITPRTDSPPHYDIQKEGFVQQISYVTEGASATLRLVPDEEAKRMLSDTEPMETAPSQKFIEQSPLAPPRPPPPTPATMSAESSPIPKRRRLGAKPLEEKVSPAWAPRPQAPPPQAEQPMEVEEELMPQSVADAKRMFETPEEAIPPAKAAPVHRPTQPAPKHKVPEKKPTKKRVKLPSPPSYEIEREGPVQEINYASETESGYLRFVSEDELDTPRKIIPAQKPVPAPQRKPVPEKKMVSEQKWVPERKLSPERKPVPEQKLLPEKKPVAEHKPAKKRVKFPSPPGYEIEKEGPVQQISYASDTESGYLRLVSEDELDRSSHYEICERGPVQEIHYVSDTEAGTLRLVHTTEDESDRNDDLQPPHQPEIPFSLQTKYEQTRYNKPLSPREKKKAKKPSPPKEQIPRDLDRESAVREFIRREGETPAEEDIYTKDKQQAPKFKTPLKDLTNLKENANEHKA